MSSCYWVYILLCANGSYYTGYTVDLERRYHEHITGTGGCKYTRSFKPLKIAAAWQVDVDKAMAMKIERQIKKMTRAEKEALILKPDQFEVLFFSTPIASN